MLNGIEPSSEKKGRSIWREYIESIIIGIIIAMVVRIFLVQPMRLIIPEGQKMANNSPTINTGQYVFINKLYYFFFTPARGDLAIAQMEDNSFTGRVIGLPGENIRVEDGVVFCNNIELIEPYTSDFGKPDKGVRFQKRLDGYLLLGDNRSRDAFRQQRHLIEVHREKIKGRIFFIYSFWRWKKNDKKIFGFLGRPTYNIKGESIWVYKLSSSKFQIFFKL